MGCTQSSQADAPDVSKEETTMDVSPTPDTDSTIATAAAEFEAQRSVALCVALNRCMVPAYKRVQVRSQWTPRD